MLNFTYTHNNLVIIPFCICQVYSYGPVWKPCSVGTCHSETDTCTYGKTPKATTVSHFACGIFNAVPALSCHLLQCCQVLCHDCRSQQSSLTLPGNIHLSYHVNVPSPETAFLYPWLECLKRRQNNGTVERNEVSIRQDKLPIPGCNIVDVNRTRC